jgi:hypothetical protein
MLWPVLLTFQVFHWKQLQARLQLLWDKLHVSSRNSKQHLLWQALAS